MNNARAATVGVMVGSSNASSCARASRGSRDSLLSRHTIRTSVSAVRSAAADSETAGVDSTQSVPTRREVAHAQSERDPAAHDVHTAMTDPLPEQSPRQRQRARLAGWLMASTFLTSIPAALILYEPVLNDTGYILGAGDDTRVTLGALLEIFLMIGNVGTAVVMFPILRRYSETLSLSYVASRTIEATIIGVGAISLLSVVTLRDDLAASIGANGTSLDIAGQTLVAIHDWTFLFGPGFCVGVNGILLGWMMYRTGLMPPRLAVLGVIGGPLIFLSAIAVLFGAYEQDGLHALFSLPEGVFEAAFAIYLIVKGFRPSPILDDTRFAGRDGDFMRPAAAP